MTHHHRQPIKEKAAFGNTAAHGGMLVKNSQVLLARDVDLSLAGCDLWIACISNHAVCNLQRHA